MEEYNRFGVFEKIKEMFNKKKKEIKEPIQSRFFQQKLFTKSSLESQSASEVISSFEDIFKMASQR